MQQGFDLDPYNDTVAMSSVQGVALTLDRLGIDSDAVLRSAGLAPRAINDVSQRVSIEVLSRIISQAVSSELGPLFGLKFAENIHATTYHCYGLMLLASPTLRQFCERLTRYYAWVTTDKSVTFELEGDLAKLVYHCLPTPGDSPLERLARVSGWAATWVRMLRMATTPQFVPSAVHFTSCAPVGFVEDYERYFGCPLSFDASQDALCFAVADLDAPLAGGNAELARSSERQVFEQLSRLGAVSCATRVRIALMDLLPTTRFSRSQVAEFLNLSEPNLVAQLTAEGTSHQSLLLATRKELAHELVRYTDKSIHEVAYRLGFSDCSNFARSYRRWFSRCPSESRGAAK